MQHNHAGRLTIIFGVILVALVGIFLWPQCKLFDSSLPLYARHNLKPGIDIAGGTSLLYEIQVPPGETSTGDLADRVAASLKKRVDPDGVKNYVWRPQNPNRLEIQMPLTAGTQKAKEALERYRQAERTLAAANIKPTEVKAILNLAPAQRDPKVAELIRDNPWAKRVVGGLVKIQDETTALKADPDPAHKDANLRKIVEELEPQQKKLSEELDTAQISVPQLKSMMELSRAAIDKAKKEGKPVDVKAKEAEQSKRLVALVQQAPDYPARVTAIDGYAAAFNEYANYKGSGDDAEDLKRLLKGSGVLEFHILADMRSQEAQQMIRSLREKGPAVVSPDGSMKWYEVDRPDQLTGRDLESYLDKKWVLASTKTEDEMIHKEGATPWGLNRAYQTTDGRSAAQVVGFEFDAQGSSLFGDLTGRNIGKPLAIMLDDKVISAPNIQSRIDGHGIITGDRSDKDRNYLISTLNAGSLPARLANEPISERTITPAVGGSNLRAGFISCILALLLVGTFMIAYYHLSGLVATFAVFLNMVLILGVLAMFNATFTLPGIAALVLTVGTSVDANVLIFERLREEQHRGLSLRMAVHNAYDRAFSAILDSNVITIITSLILYWQGSEEVKGFGLTLLIGIVSSLFTALFVTKTIFDVCIDRFGLKTLGSLPLSWPRLDKALKPHIDWMGKAWMFYTASGILLALGLTAFLVRGRDMFSIDFVSGTNVEFKLKTPMKEDAVRARLEQPAYAADLPGLQLQAVSTTSTDKEYEVSTPNPASDKVKDAVLKAMEGLLDLEPKSDFASANLDPDRGAEEFRAARGRVYIAIDSKSIAKGGELEQLAGFSPVDSEKHLGGVAFVLKDIAPKMSATEIGRRVDRARLQANMPYREMHVDSPLPSDEPTNVAVVLVSATETDINRGEDKWRDDLVSPMWKVVCDALQRPPVLQRVTKVSAAVAGDTQTAAYTALAMSIAGVLIYIWLRFGNFKFGGATVVAMLHDVMLVTGFIGISHLVSMHVPWLAKALLMEPFRIDLTLVAAILTVMSYSMLDTIVVFDRIRENRGKFGMMNRQLINDSINQTLSRTLLTVGVTFMSVFMMYVFGGSGVHGFTFALLVGVIVGSYSSIAIASPLLQLGKNKVVQAGQMVASGRTAPAK